ncbi:hypothetical protein [Methylobacterium sp. A52T]
MTDRALVTDGDTGVIRGTRIRNRTGSVPRAGGVETRPEAEKPAAPTAAPTRAACAIDGNVSRKGGEIDQLPGTRAYRRTVIDTSNSERLLRGEVEAEAASRRAARG